RVRHSDARGSGAPHAPGGVPEVVRDRGRLVPPGNPTALAAALRSVLDDLDRARAEVLSIRAEVVRNHDVADLVRRTEAIYRAAASVVSPAAAPRG
ncbi:MAG: hypothetical protein AAF602_02890, partial [Myxococcota bacterium]